MNTDVYRALQIIIDIPGRSIFHRLRHFEKNPSLFSSEYKDVDFYKIKEFSEGTRINTILEYALPHSQQCECLGYDGIEIHLETHGHKFQLEHVKKCLYMRNWHCVNESGLVFCNNKAKTMYDKIEEELKVSASCC